MSYKISEYPVKSLTDFAEIQPGFAFKSDRFLDNDNSDHIPLVKGENLQQGYIDWLTAKYWQAEEYEDFEKYHLLPGDIVIAMDRPWVTAGLKWSYIKEHDPKALLVQRVARLRANKGLNQTYLRCLISSNYFSLYVQPIVTGVNVPHISGKQIGDFKIPVPNIEIQQKIAAILSAYDDLIENNKRRIVLLEKMAEEIYREWFVRFRFPGYQTAEFEKGIPKGWKELPVADIFDYLEGPGIRNWQYTEAGFPFINIRLIQDGDLNVSAANFISENEAKGKYAHFQLNAEDYVVSTSGTLGRGAVVQQHHLPLLLNTSVIRFRQKVLNTKSFMYEYLKSDLFVKQIETYATGAAQQNFGPMHLGFMKILKPTDEILEKFESICIPLYEQVTLFRKQIVNLKMTKDLLLPRLISGKLSVEDLDIQFPPSMQEDSAA